jgi:hypothetical protein
MNAVIISPRPFIARDCATCCDQPTPPSNCPSCKGRGGFGPYRGGTAVVVISPGVDDPPNGIYWAGRTSK